MQSYHSNQTIAAIATPPGEGGIGIIRISGKEAIPIANQIFSQDVTQISSHTVRYGKIIENGHVLDEVLLLAMHAPKTFTGEDVVEIQCHGGSFVTKRVLSAALEAGATPAGPGEFTYQAFMNGKVDLAQAEAIQTFIGAKNELAMESAGQQLAGRLSSQVESFQKQLLDAAATLEALVDFPEEGLEFSKMEELVAHLEGVKEEMERLIATFEDGKKIEEGIKLSLVGPPNAGKSSLMNALLGEDRAIVTAVPGTTRDLLEAPLFLGGLHYHLVDTAGIRETEEVVEQEGIRRSKQAIDGADVILLLLDLSRPLEEDHHEILSLVPKEKTLLVWNKQDLPHNSHAIEWPEQVSISAKSGEGLEQLKERLDAMIWKKGPPAKDEVVLTSVRHKTALAGAALDLQTVIDGCRNSLSPELISADMRSCLGHLSSIIGIDISEEVLSEIFSKFCVGK